jgi:hypothetical protein
MMTNQLQQESRAKPRQNWQHFFWVLVPLIIVYVIAGLLPTPGAWSDTRSQWMPVAVLAPASLALFIATHWIFRRDGRVFKLQAIILWTLFGFVFLVSVFTLYESAEFLREVRRTQLRSQDRQPNEASQAIRAKSEPQPER